MRLRDGSSCRTVVDRPRDLGPAGVVPSRIRVQIRPSLRLDCRSSSSGPNQGESLRLAEYYADPTNRFYADLHRQEPAAVARRSAFAACPALRVTLSVRIGARLGGAILAVENRLLVAADLERLQVEVAAVESLCLGRHAARRRPACAVPGARAATAHHGRHDETLVPPAHRRPPALWFRSRLPYPHNNEGAGIRSDDGSYETAALIRHSGLDGRGDDPLPVARPPAGVLLISTPSRRLRCSNVSPGSRPELGPSMQPRDQRSGFRVQIPSRPARYARPLLADLQKHA